MKKEAFIFLLLIGSSLYSQSVMRIWKSGVKVDSMFVTSDLKISFGVNSVNTSNGLVAYYPFSGNANDASGNGNNGVVNGTNLASDRFGLPDKAYYFPGANGYISVANSETINIADSNSFAISFWINTEKIQKQGIISKWGPNTQYNQYLVFMELNGKIGFWANASSAGLYSNSALSINQWVHVLCETTETQRKIYINGVLDTQDSGIFSRQSSTQNLEIGRMEGSNYYFKGTIDDIRIYNRVLNEVEIQTLFHDGNWAGRK